VAQVQVPTLAVSSRSKQHSFTVDQAYQLMRRHARNNNASLRQVAEAIVAVGLQV